MANRKLTMTDVVTQALRENGNNPRKAYLSIAHRVGTEPLVYRTNPPKGSGLKREPRAVGAVVDPYGKRRKVSDEQRTQHEKCLGQCYAILSSWNRSGRVPPASNTAPAPDPTPAPVSDPKPQRCEHRDAFTNVRCTNDAEPMSAFCSDHTQAPAPAVVNEPVTGDAEWYLTTLWRAREIISDANTASVKGGAIPEVGTRAILDGAKSHKVGIPFAASLWSVALDWTPEIRNRLQVTEFDWTSLSLTEPGMPDPVEVAKLDTGHHESFAAVVRLAQARQNIALIGPAGCGKTELARQVADYLSLPFAMLPMSGGITRGDLCGTEALHGFRDRDFPTVFSETGGVFLADEMDRANPKVLPVLNSALAGGLWKNPMKDKSEPPLKRHPNFVFVAAMNTMGIGADRTYTAAERLDGATRDRIATNRIVMDYDRELERRIFEAILSA